MSTNVYPTLVIDASGRTRAYQFNSAVLSLDASHEDAIILLQGRFTRMAIEIQNTGLNAFTSALISVRAHPNGTFLQYLSNSQLNAGIAIPNTVDLIVGNPTTVAVGGKTLIMLDVRAMDAVSISLRSTGGTTAILFATATIHASDRSPAAAVATTFANVRMVRGDSISQFSLWSFDKKIVTVGDSPGLTVSGTSYDSTVDGPNDYQVEIDLIGVPAHGATWTATPATVGLIFEGGAQLNAATGSYRPVYPGVFILKVVKVDATHVDFYMDDQCTGFPAGALYVTVGGQFPLGSVIQADARVVRNSYGSTVNVGDGYSSGIYFAGSTTWNGGYDLDPMTGQSGTVRATP